MKLLFFPALEPSGFLNLSRLIHCNNFLPYKVIEVSSEFFLAAFLQQIDKFGCILLAEALNDQVIYGIIEGRAFLKHFPYYFNKSFFLFLLHLQSLGKQRI